MADFRLRVPLVNVAPSDVKQTRDRARLQLRKGDDFKRDLAKCIACRGAKTGDKFQTNRLRAPIFLHILSFAYSRSAILASFCSGTYYRIDNLPLHRYCCSSSFFGPLIVG